MKPTNRRQHPIAKSRAQPHSWGFVGPTACSRKLANMRTFSSRAIPKALAVPTNFARYNIRSVVMLETEASTGTGFFVSRQSPRFSQLAAFIVTNKHVLSEDAETRRRGMTLWSTPTAPTRLSLRRRRSKSHSRPRNIESTRLQIDVCAFEATKLAETLMKLSYVARYRSSVRYEGGYRIAWYIPRRRRPDGRLSSRDGDKV